MVSKIFHVLIIYVVEGVIGCLRSGRNCIASAPLPLKLFAQRRIPAMLIGCDEVEDEEEGTEANNDENWRHTLDWFKDSLSISISS